VPVKEQRKINLPDTHVKEFDKLLKNIKDLFSEDELGQIAQAYEQMKSSGKAEARLIRQVVPIEQWINDPYYVGPDVTNIYPFWKEKAIDVFSRPIEDKINEIILTGAIGTGKSTFAVLCVLRVIYELSCYEHIAALFNLFGVSRIAFAYLSVTKEQAQNTGFALMTEWLDSIPYFKEKFKRKDRLDSMLIWPQERMIVTYGSVANHFLGMNLFGSILDEANFFAGRSKEDADIKMNSKVSGLYTQIMTRSESRFIINGINYSLSILVSSSTVESSFTEERIEKAKNNKHTYIVSPSLWDVKPGNYKGGHFLVYTGGDGIDPFVIDSIEDINTILQQKGLKQISHNLPLENAKAVLPINIQSRLLSVPDEHRASFQGDIIIALQDLAGYSVSAANKLFNSEKVYESCVNDALSHPFSREKIVISTTSVSTQEGYIPIKAYLRNNIIFNRLNMQRFMHIDLALTGDSLGIAMCYISGWQTIYKGESNYNDLDYDSEKIEDEIKIPVLTYDFMLRIDPPKKPNKISLSKVRDFIVYLRNEKGINFGKITADQFQSEQMLQELEELGFNVGRLSVDRTADAYLGFTSLMYDGRVNFYDYKPFKREIFGVVYYPAKNKVDHTATGSKDVSDAVVGAAYNAIKSEDKTDVTQQSLVDIFIESNKGSDEEQYEKRVDDFLKNLSGILIGRKKI